MTQAGHRTKADSHQDQDKPSHKEVDAPAKHIDTRQAGQSKGVFGILQSLTSGNVSRTLHSSSHVTKS
jgi:hypothetical protein